MDDIGISELLKMLVVLGFVVFLMIGLAHLLKRFGLTDKSLHTKSKRLRVLESIPLNARRRLMIIQRDDVEHLVICGPDGETVVETHIEPVQDKPHSDDNA